MTLEKVMSGVLSDAMKKHEQEQWTGETWEYLIVCIPMGNTKWLKHKSIEQSRVYPQGLSEDEAIKIAKKLKGRVYRITEEQRRIF